MRKNLYFLLASVLLLLQACEKTEYVESSPQLEFTVVQDNIVLVEGATVTLFDTRDDWETRTNEVQSLQTNSKGIALFEDLQEQKYYFFVEKGEMDNLSDIGATSEPLKTGQRSQVLVKIMENAF